MKTKLFLFISLLVGAHCPDFFGISLYANDIDTVWMRWMDISAKHVDISPDAKYIAASDDNSVELYDLQTGTKLHSLGGITHVIFTKDSQYLIGWYHGGFVKMVEIENWQLVDRFVKSPDDIARLSYNSDSTKLIASYSDNEGFCVWDIASGQIVDNVIFNQSNDNVFYGTTKVEFINNDSEILYGYGYTIDPHIPSSKSKYVTKIVTNDPTHTELYRKNDLLSFKISPQRQYYLAWKRVNDETVGADLIDLNNNQQVLFFEGFPVNMLSDFAFSSDDKYLAIAYNFNKKIEIWNILNQTLQFTYQPGSYNAVALSSDNKYLVGDIGKLLLLWPFDSKINAVEEYSIQTTITYPNPSHNIFNLEFDLLQNYQTTIDMVDLSGQVVKIIDNNFLPVGHHFYQVNISDLPSGIYTLRILSGNFSFNSSIIKTN